MTGITDHLAKKQADTGRILAACASVLPVSTLQAMQGLTPSLITDSLARAYLKAMAKRRAELETADSDNQIVQAVELAWNQGIQLDLSKWQCWIMDHMVDSGNSLETIAQTAAQDLRRLAIAQSEVTDLLQDLQLRGVYA